MKEGSIRGGGAIFGAAMAGFGIMHLARLDVVPGLEPFPTWMPGRVIWVVLVGVLLLAAGASLAAGLRVRLAATTLAIVLGVWLALLHGPRMAVRPTNPGVWVPACETLALAAAAWLFSATLMRNRERDESWRRVAIVARLCFGIAFLAFGLSHFLYHGYVESVIPGWIPGHRFWAFATGVAHLAAGVSLVANVRARLAATLLAIMFGSWVLMVHIPRVVAHPDPNEWGSLLVALAMCGGSWLVAECLTATNAEAVWPGRPELTDPRRDVRRATSGSSTSRAAS